MRLLKDAPGKQGILLLTILFLCHLWFVTIMVNIHYCVYCRVYLADHLPLNANIWWIWLSLTHFPQFKKHYVSFGRRNYRFFSFEMESLLTKTFFFYAFVPLSLSIYHYPVIVTWSQWLLLSKSHIVFAKLVKLLNTSLSRLKQHCLPPH